MVRFHLGPMVIHLVSHPDYIKQVLVTHQHRYNKDTRSSAKIAGITGAGLLTNSGDAWLTQRRLMQPVFNAQRLVAYTDLMIEATDRMLDGWQVRAAAGETVDVASEMMRLTCTLVARILLGADVSADIDEVERSATIVMGHTWRRLERIVDPPLWLPTPGNLGFRRAKRRLDRIVYRLIAERRGEAGAAKDDLLARLLKARDDTTGGGMSEEQLHNETITLLLAGHETTANALSWTWYLLARNPHWRQQARDEVVGLLGQRAPTAEDLPRLDLVTRVFQEAMRLYPPIWIMERRVLEDDTIGGYHIPAGSSLEISPYVTHRHPEFWDNPEAFDPDRFTPERSSARPQYAYLPFGGGQRLCIGSHLAMLEAQVILSRVLQRFRLELVSGCVVEPMPGITLRLRHGLPMNTYPHPIDRHGFARHLTASGVLARLSYSAAYYDAANRVTASVDGGTNGGVAWTRPDDVPDRSDTVLVTSTIYNDAGWPEDEIDPRGIDTRTYYDNLGRAVITISGYTDGTPTDDSDATTEYTYDGDGNIVLLAAMEPGSTLQQTEYVYGVTIAGGSAIDSNDVLAAVWHPDPTTGIASPAQADTYTVNALGQDVTATDRNGTTHTYTYDVLGRLTADAVTTLGAGVDGSILRIEYAYDALGDQSLITSYDADSGGDIVNQVEDVYNGLGQFDDRIPIASAVDPATTLSVQYAYSEMGGAPTTAGPSA